MIKNANQIDSDQITVIRSKVNVAKRDPVRSLLLALIDFSEIDMDDSPLCDKLANQAVDKFYFGNVKISLSSVHKCAERVHTQFQDIFESYTITIK